VQAEIYSIEHVQSVAISKFALFAKFLIEKYFRTVVVLFGGNIPNSGYLKP